MKKILVALLLVVGKLQAETNYVYYATNSGKPHEVATTFSYNVDTDKVSIGGKVMFGIDWTKVGVGFFTNSLPIVFTNVAQVVLTPILPMTENVKKDARVSNLSTAALLGLLDCINSRLAADKKISLLELKAAVKARME